MVSMFCYVICTHRHFIYISFYEIFIQPEYALNLVRNNLRSLGNKLSQVLSLRSVEILESLAAEVNC